MNSFEELLKKQENGGMTDIIEAARKSTSQASFKDERFWSPSPDKAGNAFAIFRFLPSPDHDVGWVKTFEHSFKSPISGKWFWENCPTTIGKPCPVCEENGKKWSAGIDDLKKIASARKRKTKFISNILILQDSANPESVGKVFLYKFGTKIFEKIMNAMEPAFEDEVAFNPFNLLTGASFKLKQKSVEGYPNYDSSEFGKQEALFGGDKQRLKDMYDHLHEILPFISDASFKPYAELRGKYFSITGEEDTSMPQSMFKTQEAPAPRSLPEPSFKHTESPPFSISDDDDDDIAYFQKLANSTED